MTNGEKIQTILDVDKDCTEVHGENGTMTFTVTQDFWNAEYKEPTKNDLVAGYISRADAIKAIQDKAKKLTNEDTINGLCGAAVILSNLPSVTPQEPFKPMVEIDLDYVIKQKYIEREVLDKLRAEIEQIKEAEYQIYGKGSWRFVDKCLDIIDKYKTEIEPQESEDV